MKLLLLIGFSSFCFSTQTAAQTWNPVLSFVSGDVEGLGWDASGRIFVGTDSGSYLSTNNGDEWRIDTSGFIADEAFCFTSTPAHTLLTGTELGAVLRSTDEGEHWLFSGSGIPAKATIHAILTDRERNILAASADSGVYFSSDDGLDWERRDFGLPTIFCGAMIEAPNGDLYVGLNGSIAKSMDEGLSWAPCYTTDAKTEILALAADSSGFVFAGTSTGQILRSTNSGLTWDPRLPLFAVPVRCISVFQNKVIAGTYGDGILLSTDLGGTWNAKNTNLADDDLKVLVSTATPDGYFFFGTLGAKAFRSDLPLSVLRPDEFKEQGLSLACSREDRGMNLRFRLPSSEFICLQVFDINGRAIRTLCNKHLDAGDHSALFDCGSDPSGVYFVVLTTPTGTVRTAFCV